MEQFTYFWASKSPFSNWYKCQFEVDGQKFSSSEQYMMYGKAMLFGDTEIAGQILKTQNVREQKALGRQVKGFIAEKWNENAQTIVKRGCREKFRQNPALLAELLATQGTALVEASPDDAIWGIGLAEDDPRARNRETWIGTNWLGELLTELREEFLASQNP